MIVTGIVVSAEEILWGNTICFNFSDGYRNYNLVAFQRTEKIHTISSVKYAVDQGSGTFLGKRAIKATYF